MGAVIPACKGRTRGGSCLASVQMHLCACCECANTPQGVSVQTPTRLPPTCVCKSARFTTGGCDVCTFLPLRSCKRCPPRRAPCEGGARACEGPRWEGGCEGGAGGGRGLARLLRGRRIPAPLMQWRPAQLGWGSGDVGCGGGGRHVGVSLCPPRCGWDGGPPPCAVRGAARNAAPPPLTHTPLGAERGGLHTRVGAGGGWGGWGVPTWAQCLWGQWGHFRGWGQGSDGGC